MKKLVINILNNKNYSKRNSYIWYAMGSTLFAMSTLLMTIIVSQVGGKEIGGMFSFGLSFAQWISTIAYFEIRTYQVTDVNREFLLADYLSSRIIFCILSFCISIVFIFVNSYSISKMILVILLCIYKILESIADIFEGEYQRNGRIDISGKSMFIRILVCMITFIISLIITKNIIFSLILMVLVECIIIYYVNIVTRKEHSPVKIKFDKQIGKDIYKRCYPLAICNFLSTYIINSSKFSVDRILGDEFQLYYTAVFMPNLVINLFSGFIFKPIQTLLAQQYVQKKIKEFRKSIMKVCIFILLVTRVCMIGAYFLGIPVLSFLYGVKLEEYKFILILLLFTGGLNAINIILYYVMTVIRMQKKMIPIYLCVSIISLFLLDKMVWNMKLLGAAIGYFILVIILGFMLIMNIIKYSKRG